MLICPRISDIPLYFKSDDFGRLPILQFEGTEPFKMSEKPTFSIPALKQFLPGIKISMENFFCKIFKLLVK